jgi:hypothetical protein
MGTASLIDPLVVLADPPLSRRLATQPGATKLRFGIASLANDGGIIEVIDGREIIDVYEHDGERFVAVGLAGLSAAAFDQIFPDGTTPSEENLVQAVRTYLDKATSPDAAAPAAQPDDPPETPSPDNSWFCKLHPKDPRCKKK